MQKAIKQRLRFSDIFSPALYWQGIKRLRLVGIIGLLSVFVPTLLLIINYYTATKGQIVKITITNFNFFIEYGMPIIGIVSVITVFSFLNKRRECDFYHALPYSRLCVFNSLYLAAITWTMVILFISQGILLLTVSRAASITFNAGLDMMLSLTVTVLWLMSATILAKSLTGTRFSNVIAFIILYVSISLTSVTLILYLIGIMPILQNSELLKLLTLQFNHILLGGLDSLLVGETTTDMTVWIVLTVIYNLFAGAAFVTRKSETAGRASSRQWSAHLLCSLLAFPFITAIICMFLNLETFSLFPFLLYPLPFVLFFSSEIIIFKSFKQFIKSILVFLITIVVSVSSILGVYLFGQYCKITLPVPEDLLYVSINENAARIPDYISVYYSPLSFVVPFDEEEDMQFFTSAVKEYADNPKDKIASSQEVVTFVYTNGKTITRTMALSDNSIKEYQTMCQTRLYYCLIRHFADPDYTIKAGSDHEILSIKSYVKFCENNTSSRPSYLIIKDKPEILKTLYTELENMSSEQRKSILAYQLPDNNSGYTLELTFAVNENRDDATIVAFKVIVCEDTLPESYRLINEAINQ